MKLYNTMTRSLEQFHPADKSNVKIFTCGPSVYRRPHIGNYRTYIFEDLLVRYLEYKGYGVNRVINFTDVEDKTIEESCEMGISPEELTDKVKKTFRDECRQLNIKLPDFIPSSATSVETAAELIQILMDKGYAYRYDGNIFFDPLKKKDFGKLARLDMSRWPKNKVRFKLDTYPGSRWNRGDFILWHGYRDNCPAVWDTVIGRGRPSWNIQDPAMIYQHLGTRIDIKCGGIDNIVRHHDYNIAIMEAVSGKEFSKYYLHGEHLVVDGKKMSKSLGNIYYPDDIIKPDKDAEYLRFFLFGKHYRKKLNFTREVYNASCNELDAVNSAISRILNGTGSPGLAEKIRKAFNANMDNDLHVSGFIKELKPILASAENSGERFSEPETKELKKVLEGINEVLHLFTINKP